jgi:hypothetical protein
MKQSRTWPAPAKNTSNSGSTLEGRQGLYITIYYTYNIYIYNKYTLSVSLLSGSSKRFNTVNVNPACERQGDACVISAQYCSGMKLVKRDILRDNARNQGNRI